MRILMITTSYPRWSGDASGAFVHNLAAGLVEAGHHVQVLTPTTDGASGTTVMDGVQVCRVGRSNGTIASEPGGILPGLYRAPWRLWPLALALIELAKVARNQAREVDVVHGHWAFPGGFIASHAAARCGCAAVVTVHGIDVNLPLRYRIFRPLFRAAVKGATRIMAVSQAMYDGTLTLGVTPSRVTLVRLGVRDVGLARTVPALPGAPTRFLFIGSLTGRKGLDVLIEAFAHATPHAEMSLRIVGDGPLRQDLERQILASGSLARIEMVGLVAPADLQSQFALSDVLVLPSRSEGLGLVCVEAMMAGLPVIASDIPGPRDVVKNGLTGILVPVDEPVALAEAMLELARDPARRMELGRSGRDWVDSLDLTLSAAVIRHLDTYTIAIREAAT